MSTGYKKLFGQKYTVRKGVIYSLKKLSSEQLKKTDDKGNLLYTRSHRIRVRYEIKTKFTLGNSIVSKENEDHFTLVLSEAFSNGGQVTAESYLSEYLEEQGEVYLDYLEMPLQDFRRKYVDSPFLYTDDPFDKNTSFKIRKDGGKWVLSAVVVSAKLRPKWDESENEEDHVPATWEFKFSPGFAYTYPWREWITYKGGKKVSSTSINFGFLGNIGSTDINNKTTRPEYPSTRKALTFSTGGVVNLAINKFDFGLFGGFDLATGEGAKDWIYQGQPHFGFIFGYHLIKNR